MSPRAQLIMFCFLFESLVVIPSVKCFEYDLHHARVISGAELEDVMAKDSVSVIYYFKRALPRMDTFFKEYDKSAEYLQVYNVDLTIVDCPSNPSVEACSKPKTEYNIYTIRNNTLLLNLELSTMFDVNSIMSNILQLVLLYEVPIIQSTAELNELLEQHKMKRNVIIGYFKAIGTEDHRVFMEIAYAYLDKYAFTVTTEKDTIKNYLSEDELKQDVWFLMHVLYCEEAAASETCRHSIYRGKNDLPSLAKFFRTLGHSKCELPQDLALCPCGKEKVDCFYMFYNKSTMASVQDVLPFINYNLHGIVVTVLVDLDKVDEKEFPDLPKSNGPLAELFLHDSRNLTMIRPWNAEEIADFVLIETDSRNPFGRYKPPSESEVETEQADRIQSDLPNLPTVEEVETQDDEVADTVYRLSITTPMVGVDLIPALTDKTHPSVGEKDLLMVLYYLPFDARSMAFLRAYGEAVVKFPSPGEAPLALVNCYDWTDVCQSLNITAYPTIKIFKKGLQPIEYKGALDTDAVVSTMKLMQQQNPLILKTDQALEKFRMGKLPEDISQYTDVSVLGAIPTSSKEVLGNFQNVARELHGVVMFGLMEDQLISKLKGSLDVEPPAIIAFKHKDLVNPMAVLSATDLTVNKIAEFIEKSRVPTVVELTPLVFPLLYKRDQPLVVLFCKDSDSESVDVISQLAQSGEFSQLIFTWMNAEPGNRVAVNILSEYTKSVHLPAISVVYNRLVNYF